MNAFSIKRVGLLLYSEFKIQGRQMLIVFATITAAVAFITLISDLSLQSETRTSNVLFFFTPMILYAFSFIYFLWVHNLIHEKNTLPYISIPATALEKYIQIIFLGLLFYAMGIASVQVNYWIELWKFPTLINTSGFLSSEAILINNTSLVNPLWGINEKLGHVSLFFTGNLLLTSSLIPKKRFSIPAYILLPIAIIALLSYVTIIIFGDNSTIDNALESKMGSTENYIRGILCSIGIIGLIGSYFAIRNKQVKS